MEKMATMNVGFFSAVLMVFLAMSNTDGEKPSSVHLNLVSIKKKSPCQLGLIHGEDDFTVTGLVDTEHVSRSDNPRLQCNLWGTNFNETVCKVSLNSCLKQNSSSTASCYCVEIGKGDYHVVFTKRADVRYSNARIQLGYDEDTDNQFFYISLGSWKIPKTFYKDTEELSLESNGIKVNLTSSQCTLPLRKGENTIKYCCSNAPSCEVKITEPDGRESGSMGCYTLTANETSESLPYIFSYSVCGVESSQTYNCTGKLVSDNEGETLHPGIIVTTVIAAVAVFIIGTV